MVIYKCNMAGPFHIENDMPCQDSFAIFQNEAFSVLAVADGLGSEQYSDVGAEVAAQTAVQYCSERIAEGMEFPEIKKIMNNAFVSGYKAILTRAAEDGNDAGEYDTTICLAIYDGEHLYFAQSGDSGLVALLENGEYCRITTQQRDEEGRVFPLCWGPEKWEFGFVDSPVSAFMLMTDGVFEQICPKLMRKKFPEINIPLARRFLDRFDCTEEDVPELEKAVHEYLEHYPRHLLDDDKTVVVLVNPKRRAKEKEAAYYDIPDWEAIRDEAEKRLSGVICSDPEEDGDVIELSSPDEELTSEYIAISTDISHRDLNDHQVGQLDDVKKKEKIRHTSKIGFDIIIVFCLLLFGLLAWVAKDKIEQHMAAGALGVLVTCFLANASVLLPSSSILIVIEYSMLINSFLVAICGAIGSALGEMTGFYVGKYGRRVIPGKFMMWIKAKFNCHKYLMILIFSLLPLPVFDIVGMISGAMNMNPLKFFSICFTGKLIKMFCYIWLAYELLPLL